MSLSRREVLGVGSYLVLMCLSGCSKRGAFKREAKILPVARIRELLKPVQHIPEVDVLVYRDNRGWSALSTRCSYDGCDLSYQESSLYCVCCKSVFSLTGLVLDGPATFALPWLSIFEQTFEEGSYLFVNTGKIVPAGERFTTDRIETYVSRLRPELDNVGESDKKIPEVLLGKSDGELGAQWVPYRPEGLRELHDLEEEKRVKNPIGDEIE